MIKQWIDKLTYGMAGCALFFFAIASLFWLTQKHKIEEIKPMQEKVSLPKGPFEQPKEAYAQIAPPVLTLKFSPIRLQLPDLSKILAYYGRNERPDADPETVLMHFSLKGSRDIISIPANAKLFLIYDREEPRSPYHFSENNAPTSLWITARPKDAEAELHVFLTDEQGQMIQKPKSNAKFTIKPRPFSRAGAISQWKIEGNRVDGTLLARQKARWYGKDLFLEAHGGEEFQSVQDKHRIDFNGENAAYSIFVNIGDTLIWNGKRWEIIAPGEKSRKSPLLVVKKVDDRIMNFELWNTEGKIRIPLNLIRSTERWMPQNVIKSFKFVGARTRTQFAFEINGKRMLISPQDWLLYQDGVWVKLDSPEEIDAYVDRRLVGPLFVFEEIGKDEDGNTVLIGTLYSATRSAKERLKLAIQQSGTITAIKDSEEEQEDEDWDDED